MGTAKSRQPELLAWMKETGTSQLALARLLGIRQPQISRYINGSLSLSLEKVIKLARLTSIPVEKLLTGRKAAQILKLLGKRMNSSTEKSNGTTRVA